MCEAIRACYNYFIESSYTNMDIYVIIEIEQIVRRKACGG